MSAMILKMRENHLHNDHLGTLRQTTGASRVAGASRVFTAFGERLPGSVTDRFGYVGAWGYEAATSNTPGDPYVTGFPFLHVGARYYDPSSGRFLQRDPIGIRGSTNVYSYVGARPTNYVDPLGLQEGRLLLPMPRIPGKTFGDILEEVKQEATRKGKGDKWAHYTINYRGVRELTGGKIMMPIISIGKEFADNYKPPRDWVDTILDLYYDALGYWDALTCSPPRM